MSTVTSLNRFLQNLLGYLRVCVQLQQFHARSISLVVQAHAELMSFASEQSGPSASLRDSQPTDQRPIATIAESDQFASDIDTSVRAPSSRVFGHSSADPSTAS